MKCPKCAYENPADAPYCGLCYEVLKKVPPAGGHESGTSPQLLAAIRAVCEDDGPETRAALYRELLQAVLVVPKLDHPAYERISPAPGEKPEFPFADLAPGLRGLVVFTGKEELKAFRPQGCGYVLMRGQNLFCMAAHLGASTVAVNPGGGPSGLIREGELRHLAEGFVPDKDGRMEMAFKGEIMWGPLEKPLPQAFVSEAWKLFARYPEVAKVYAVQVSINHAPRRLALAVSCPQRPAEYRAAEFMPALVGLAESHKYDAYCVIAEEHEWAADAMGIVKPFYLRA